MHWSTILTSKLTSHVKLVGATISCEPSWQGGNTANSMRHNPHVQSYFLATDQVRTSALHGPMYHHEMHPLTLTAFGVLPHMVYKSSCLQTLALAAAVASTSRTDLDCWQACCVHTAFTEDQL